MASRENVVTERLRAPLSRTERVGLPDAEGWFPVCPLRRRGVHHRRS